MKSLLVSLILIFAVQNLSAQDSITHRFKYSSQQLAKVLDDIEQKFNIKYSYADSIVSPRQITLASKYYTLYQLNSEIEKQTLLSVVKIDNRYYSIYKDERKDVEYLEEVSVVGFLSKGITKTSEKVIIVPRKSKSCRVSPMRIYYFPFNSCRVLRVRMKLQVDFISGAALPTKT